jgi:hypothetical protein
MKGIRARQGRPRRTTWRRSRAIREHQAGLRAFVRALGVEADWVDDVAQEVFLIAYQVWLPLRTVGDSGALSFHKLSLQEAAGYKDKLLALWITKPEGVSSTTRLLMVNRLPNEHSKVRQESGHCQGHS